MSTQFKPYIPSIQEPTLLVGICSPTNKVIDPTGYYQEFISLAKTRGISDEHTYFFRLRSIDAGQDPMAFNCDK